MRPPVLILHATGTNRDREAAWACELAGGAPRILPMNGLADPGERLLHYRMLVLPGGFSYADNLGAGRLWAVELAHRFADELREFVTAGRPVLGICNGFQVLVKCGLLPGRESDLAGGREVSLTRNDSGRFESRWVYLQPQPDSRCVFTAGLDELVFCPVAHGEGKFVARSEEALQRIERDGLVALRYARPDGFPSAYPYNPNGSQGDIAGICNPTGNVLGLMPHPEDHVIDLQNPMRHRRVRGGLGLSLFERGIAYASQT